MNAAGSRLRDVLLLVGRLNYAWTNTESVLIHLVAGLAGVDKETATVVFLTLGSGKGRIELVERLAKMRRTPVDLRGEVLPLMRRMTSQSRLRNKYSHCIYSFDEDGTRASTQLMRIFDGGEDLRYGKVEDLGPREMEAIERAVREIGDVNVAIWEIVRRRGFPS